MKKMVMLYTCAIFLIFTLVSAGLTGCQRASPQNTEKDPVINVINKAVKNPRIPPEVRERANIAISQWENRVIDPKPIVINACLLSFEGYDSIDLALTIFAECKDIIGFGIKEVHSSPNSPQDIIVEEVYPVYIHCPLSDIANLWRVPVQIRKGDRRKDEQSWQKYVNCDYEKLLHDYKQSEEFLKHGLGDFSSLWDATLPPVLVSIPEPNKIDVWVWVYDKAGNKSEPIKLLDFIN